MFDTVISIESFRDLIRTTAIIVIDCRHTLADTNAGERWYRESHLPGAFFMHMDRHLSGTMTGKNGRHPLPDRATMAARFGAIGIGSQTQVVAYDQDQGAMAARAWWLLKWLGHERVAVLDGGFRAWLDSGGAVNPEIPLARPVSFPVQAGHECVDADFVLAHLNDPSTLLLDARGADRFRGENETIDPIAGHIPGAMNRPFANNLDANGRFKPASTLREEFLLLLSGRTPENVIHQCGSGVTACHNLLAMEVAGLAGSRLYGGSWSEWIADPTRPIA